MAEYIERGELLAILRKNPTGIWQGVGETEPKNVRALAVLAIPGSAFELAEEMAAAFLADTDRSGIQEILKRGARHGNSPHPPDTHNLD